MLSGRLAALGRLELAPGERLPLAYAHVADPEDADQVSGAVDAVTRDRAQVLVAGEPFGVADPTSTQTVWSAQYAGVTPQQVMVRALSYVRAVALGGFCVTAAAYL